MQDSAEEYLTPGCWLQHCANTDPKVEKQKEPNLDEVFLPLRETFLDERKMNWNVWYCVFVTDKPYFNSFEYKISKLQSYSFSICWKSWYRLSLMPTHIKWIQLYSSHSVVCPTLYFDEGQTQQPLWLFSLCMSKHNFLLIIWFEK